MCGRYTLSTNARDLSEYYGAAVTGALPGESYNRAPTQQVVGVVEQEPRDADEPARQLRALRWGLVPSWSRGPSAGSPLINARVETVASKPAFRSALLRRRAVLPANGYYEWTAIKEGGRVVKQPYLIHRPDDGLLSFAALYELWPDPSKDEDSDDRWLWSVTILTTGATGPAGEVHDRTPVILPTDRVEPWLDPTLTNRDAVQRLLSGIEPPLLALREVSREVNNVRNDGPRLVEPVTADRPLALVSSS